MDRITMRIKGHYSCFPRPEHKDERRSYPIPTPSAIRMICNAVYWKPRGNWEPEELRVIKKGRAMSLMRNELRDRPNASSVVDLEKNHTQRRTTLLADVEYEVTCRWVPNPGYEIRDKDEEDDLNPTKHISIFNRRLSKGQFFKKPYGGLREFPVEVSVVDTPKTPLTDWNEDLGLMFHGIDRGVGYYSGTKATPCFFHAKIVGGVLQYPSATSSSLVRMVPCSKT